MKASRIVTVGFGGLAGFLALFTAANHAALRQLDAALERHTQHPADDHPIRVAGKASSPHPHKPTP